MSRKPLKGESSLAELNKPAGPLKDLIKGSRNMVPDGKLLRDARRGARISKLGSSGGAVDIRDVTEQLESRAAYEEVAKHEIARTGRGTYPQNPPIVPGVATGDSYTGYQVTTRPYNLRCESGHLTPANSKVFTDGTTMYCPFCGKPARIQ